MTPIQKVIFISLPYKSLNESLTYLTTNCTEICPKRWEGSTDSTKTKGVKKERLFLLLNQGSDISNSSPHLSTIQVQAVRDYFLEYVIFMAHVAVILKPCNASLATPACPSLSNSTKAMSCLPGTSRTSLKPGN